MAENESPTAVPQEPEAAWTIAPAVESASDVLAQAVQAGASDQPEAPAEGQPQVPAQAKPTEDGETHPLGLIVPTH